MRLDFHCVLLFLLAHSAEVSQLGIWFTQVSLEISEINYDRCTGFLFFGSMIESGSCKNLTNGGISYLKCDKRLPVRKIINFELKNASFWSNSFVYILTGHCNATIDSTGVGNGVFNGTLCRVDSK